MNLLPDEQIVYRHKHILVTTHRLIAGDPEGLYFASLPLENIDCCEVKGRALHWLLFLAAIPAGMTIATVYFATAAQDSVGSVVGLLTVVLLLVMAWRFIRPRRLTVHTLSGQELPAGSMRRAGLVELIEAIEKARNSRDAGA